MVVLVDAVAASLDKDREKEDDEDGIMIEMVEAVIRIG